jgi:hypothetical protein
MVISWDFQRDMMGFARVFVHETINQPCHRDTIYDGDVVWITKHGNIGIEWGENMEYDIWGCMTRCCPSSLAKLVCN